MKQYYIRIENRTINLFIYSEESIHPVCILRYLDSPSGWHKPVGTYKGMSMHPSAWTDKEFNNYIINNSSKIKRVTEEEFDKEVSNKLKKFLVQKLSK